ncbi:hypothetical protein RFI_05616, partial [Reticulomyxa filosa]
DMKKKCLCDSIHKDRFDALKSKWKIFSSPKKKDSNIGYNNRPNGVFVIAITKTMTTKSKYVYNKNTIFDLKNGVIVIIDNIFKINKKYKFFPRHSKSENFTHLNLKSQNRPNKSNHCFKKFLKNVQKIPGKSYFFHKISDKNIKFKNYSQEIRVFRQFSQQTESKIDTFFSQHIITVCDVSTIKISFFLSYCKYLMKRHKVRNYLK